MIFLQTLLVDGRKWHFLPPQCLSGHLKQKAVLKSKRQSFPIFSRKKRLLFSVIAPAMLKMKRNRHFWPPNARVCPKTIWGTILERSTPPHRETKDLRFLHEIPLNLLKSIFKICNFHLVSGKLLPLKYFWDKTISQKWSNLFHKVDTQFPNLLGNKKIETIIYSVFACVPLSAINSVIPKTPHVARTLDCCESFEYIRNKSQTFGPHIIPPNTWPITGLSPHLDRIKNIWIGINFSFDGSPIRMRVFVVAFLTGGHFYSSLNRMKGFPTRQ